MLFNSIEFIIFLIIVFLIYWRLNHRNQNIFLVIVSYIFYGWWDWRFLFLILLSTLIDFFTGLFIGATESKSRRKIFLFVSIFANIGLLGFFKYFDFFIASLKDALIFIGAQPTSLTTLGIILPVGISFYTFQTMSYTIDVYQNKIKPTKNFMQFMGFVSFFPQLVAGPIERASHLLGQFEQKRFFNYPLAIDGCRQMLWGFFKKIVIADTLAVTVNAIYGNVFDVSGWHLALATIFFAFQIYCDFSGYSDIAIGASRLFGFHLNRNFHFPYFSKNIIQFWQRWHISLSTWFRDYIFIPLGGSRVALSKYIRNILATFVISGFWHGANWTFIFWGLLHGIYFIPYAISKTHDRYKKEKESSPSLKDIHNIIFTFLLVAAGWIFFRAESITQGFYIVKKIALDLPNMLPLSELYPKKMFLIGIFVVIEWWQRNKAHPLQLGNIPKWIRWPIYYAVIILILFFGNFDYTPFIYFQF